MRALPGCAKSHLAELLLSRVAQSGLQGTHIKLNAFCDETGNLCTTETFALQKFCFLLRQKMQSFFVIEINGGSAEAVKKFYDCANEYGGTVPYLIEMSQDEENCMKGARLDEKMFLVSRVIADINMNPPYFMIPLVDPTMLMLTEYKTLTNENSQEFVSGSTVSDVVKRTKEQFQSENSKRIKEVHKSDSGSDEIMINDHDSQVGLDYLNDVDELHDYIKDNDLGGVLDIISKHPGERNFYNENGQSAMAAALRIASLNIYEHLIESELTLGNNEDIENILKHHNYNHKESIRDIHNKHAKEPHRKIVMKLVQKTKLSHNTIKHDRKQLLVLILKAFEYLYDFDLIRPVLKLASTSECLEIIIDFYHDSAEHINPTKDKYVDALTCHKSSKIYICAKALRDMGNDTKVLSILAHELAHFSLTLLYKNDSNPFTNYDFKSEKLFDEIIENCRKLKNKDAIVSRTFDSYKQEDLPAELIAGVPEIAAFYGNNEERRTLEKTFKSLFKYYTTVLEDLEKEYQLIEERKEVKEINELCRVLMMLKESEISFSTNIVNCMFEAQDDNLIILSNSCQVTMNAIYHLQPSNDCLTMFVDLKSIGEREVFKKIKKCYEFSKNSIMALYCEYSSENDVTLALDSLRINKMNQRIVLVTEKSLASVCCLRCINLSHLFSEFSRETQNNILRQIIVFQGENMTLRELCNPHIEDLVGKIPLNTLVSVRKLEIGTEIHFENDVENFVKRILLAKNDLEINAHQACEQVEATKPQPAVLIDETGMGKSTELRMMANILKKKFPSRWVYFIDLKKYCNIFKRDRSNLSTFDNSQTITQFLCENILKIKNFEADIYTHLFDTGRVVLILDAFDEISPNYKRFIINLMKGIRQHSKNQLWIASRPHLGKDLRGSLQPVEFRLKSFNEENRKEFFQKFIESKHVEADLIKVIIKDIAKFQTSITSSHFASLSFSNPLLLRMVAVMFEIDPHFDLTKANIFSIYKNFTDQMVERSFTKGPEATKSLVKQIGDIRITEFYQKTALKLFFDNSRKHFKKIISFCFKSLYTEDEDRVRVGLMYIDEYGNYQFIHRTFAEFFTATFFLEKLFLQICSAEVFEALTTELNKFLTDCADHKTVRSFLDESLGMHTAEIKKFQTNWFNNFEGFAKLIEEGQINLIRSISLPVNESEKKLWNIKNIQKVFVVAVKHQSLSFIKEFWNICEEIFAKDSQRKVFLQYDKNETVFHVAAETREKEIFEFLVSTSKDLETKKESIFNRFLIPCQQLNVFHVILRRENDFISFFSLLCNSLDSNQATDLITSKTKDGVNLFQLACQQIPYKRTAKEFLIQIENCFVAFKIIEANPTYVKDIFKLYDNRNDTVLMLVFKNYSKEVVEKFLILVRKFFRDETDVKEIFLQTNSDGLTGFHSAIMNSVCCKYL